MGKVLRWYARQHTADGEVRVIPPTEGETPADVVRRHIPERKKSDWDDVLLSAEWLLRTNALPVADMDRQIDALDRLTDSLGDACKAYCQLHPDIARAVEGAFTENLKAQKSVTELRPFTSDTDGHAVPLVVYDMLNLLLKTTFNNVMGYDADADLEMQEPPRVGSSVTNKAAQSLPYLEALSAQQRAHSTWEKAALVRQARHIWQQNKHSVPPRQPSVGAPFYNFVEDLIAALGKDWDTESTFKAWGRLRNQLK